MSDDRLMKIILSPHITEKSDRIGDKHRQISLKVMRDANKGEIKQAVEKLFDVKVSAVNVVNMKGKVKRFGQRLGHRKAWKKAYITLKEGYDLDFTGT